MTVTRDAPPAGPAPSADPLARVGRQLIEAERRLRFRRARRRIAGGVATGLLLVVALAVALLPGGPLAGSQDGRLRTPDRTGLAGGAPAVGVRGEVLLRFGVRWGGRADALVLDRVRARLAAFGYADADVRGDGSQIVAGLSWARGRGTHASQRKQIAIALGQSQLAVYDWEASVVDAGGRVVAGRTDAVSRRMSMMGGAPGAGMTLAQARAASGLVSGPTVIVQALAKDGMVRPRDDPRARFYVLRGRPPLTGADVLDVRAVRNAIEQPAVLATLRVDARRRFHELTRTISQRGQSLALPGTPSAAVAQHFALVLDGHLLSVAAVDPQRLPDGISGDRGVLIEGGFTRVRAETMAIGLNATGGPLPPLSPISLTETG